MNALRRFMFAVLVTTASAACMGTARAEPVLSQGGYLVGAFPTGDWGEVAGAGVGIDGTNFVRPDPTKMLNLRSSLGWAFNFARTVDVPQSNLGAGDVLELETSNTSLWLGIGPELGNAEGDFRGFVFGTVGLNIQWTNSNLSGTAGGQNYKANVGHAGTVFAWSAGAGFRRAVAGVPGGRLELSAEYRSGMGFKYVLPGEVTSSGTTVLWDRESHNADQILVRLGTVFRE